MSLETYYLPLVFFFFFSSRRRHTRYWRDWSSDVCSSDLERPRTADSAAPPGVSASAIAAGAPAAAGPSLAAQVGQLARRSIKKTLRSFSVLDRKSVV